LTYIRENAGAIAIGATTTLAELVESPILRAMANGVVAQAAHRSAASVLRNQATIAGTLIAEPDGILAVVLLAMDARITSSPFPPFLLGEGVGGEVGFLARRAELLSQGALVTEICVPTTNPRASLQTVERTPRDKPIVSVCAAARIEILRGVYTEQSERAQNDKVARDVRIALGGVGETAVRASAAEQALEGQTLSDAVIESAARTAAEGLTPRGDVRGSAEYRQEMAVVLTRRAVKELMV
jgi:carbon-monoxide dehydrogenase medium subunit